MIMEAMDIVTEYKILVAELKKTSPYYPDFIRVYNRDSVYFSTKVRKEFSGKWYTIHAVESGRCGNDSELSVLKRLILSAFEIQHLYLISGIKGCEDVDDLQVSEVERMAEQNKKLYNNANR